MNIGQWWRKRKLGKMKAKLAGLNARLEMMEGISVPGQPGVRPGHLMHDMLDARERIARLRESIRQIEACNP